MHINHVAEAHRDFSSENSIARKAFSSVGFVTVVNVR